MLTPVRAASNASFSSQGQTAAIVAGGLDRSVIAPAPVNAVEAADLNSAIAGKLNILLLAARQRMVEALLDIINAAGRSTSLDRDEDETNLAFASRLADTILQLPAAKIDEIERQLAGEGHNLPLRMVAEALKNPTGPEAARIVAYLEIVRYKDRDLAARAVVRSYGQNDASPMRTDVRPEIQLHEGGLATAMRQPAKAAPAPADAHARPPALMTDEKTIAAETVETAEPKTPQLEDNARSAPATSEDLAPENPVAPETEARQSMDTGDSRETAEPPAVQPRANSEKADPVIPRNWTGIVASMTEEASEMIATIIREQDVDTGLEDGPVEAAVEIDAILDDAVISDAAKTLARQPAEIPASDLRQATALHPAPTESKVAAAADRQPREIAAQPQIVPAPEAVESSHVPLAARMPDGFAYAQLPYQFAKDLPPNETAGETHHQHQHQRDDASEDQPQGDEQAQAGEEADPDPAATDTAPVRRTPRMIDADPVPQPAGAVADPVYALYQRMVGWE
ncbi:hypothetical protein PYR71_04845 [Rhizobium sp. MC63]|uniref:Uncharacterized protein n=1 Tax=Rhizobium mulingense TaxID=3031128 RepID=A0ACC6N1N6_9HYPH|nr:MULTISPECIES: hypothetical protein [unclassified Rhizobium]MDF0695850.1 hypothetical protein [Rhizobium sp. MC63]MEA3519468.1 hypothetical protein [Rhizobium sp. MJ31]